MKSLKILIAFSLVLSLLAAGLCTSASALVIHENGFGFEVNSSKHTATLVSYDGVGGRVVLPEYFYGYPVTVIDKNAFSGNESITEVVFSNTNTTVEEYAFMNCTALETVYIPENVKSFGDRAFAGCTSLKTVTMLSDIVSMPTNMFSGCTSLCELTISESIAEFGYGCFNGCSSLTNLDFASNGVMLQSYAFNGTGAESVVLSDSLIAIPDYAFTNCSQLKYVTVPDSVVLIQPNAFDYENLTIRCYYDSYAYDFAGGKGVARELLDDITLGDANGDGVISISDVTTIQRHLAEFESLDGVRLLAANIESGNDVDISDATSLQMFLAEYETDYPVGAPITV